MSNTVKKILFVATSDIHLSGFHRPYIQWLTEQGHQVDMATENRGNKTFPCISETYYLTFPRSLMKKELFSSYKRLKQIVERGNYDLVHCHTPIPSFLVRMAARKARKRGTKVLYTAHGFHFYKGAPLSRWLIYYPAEYLLSAFTDGIIAINHKDFDYINGKMWHKDSFFINGIGVDNSRFRAFTEEEKNKQRQKLELSPKDFVLLYVAEFIPRKNHAFIVRALVHLKDKIPNIKILFAGTGRILDEIKALARELGVEEYILFLGFRKDIPEISPIADIGVSSSIHEGLGLGLTEEMMCKVPIIASRIRGHDEMVIQGKTGYMYEPGKEEEFIEYVCTLYRDEPLRKEMGENAYEKGQDFDIKNALDSMAKIYRRYLDEE